MGSNLRVCSLCAEYLAPDADSTRDMIRDGVTSDFFRAVLDQMDAMRKHELRTSLRALITTCVPRKKRETAVECV